MAHQTQVQAGKYRAKPWVALLLATLLPLMAPITQANQPPEIPLPPMDANAFPPAKPGQTKVFIKLPPIQNEYRTMVELIPGKTLMADCNTLGFTGKLQTKRTVQGQIEYYELTQVAGPLTSRKICPANSKRKKFVEVTNARHTVQYNSPVPLVIYVPKGFQIKQVLHRAMD